MNKATKSVARILKDNICTFFNLLNIMIAAALAYVGAWENLLFIVIILINTAVGIVQEIKAKRQIERLTLLAQPSVAVMRDGWKINVRPGDIKQGDTLSLCAGNTVCTDCTVQNGRVWVNESVLTGESEPVAKFAGDKLLSGSSVTAGRCIATADCGADECFSSKMVNKIKGMKSGGSELLDSMKKVTKVTGFFIIPVGILLFAEAFFLRNAALDSAVIMTSAGLLGMLPKGLVLLISIGLAVGVIRLSKKNVLVRDLHSFENLAHCDVICLDKTGTLTEGSLSVEDCRIVAHESEFGRLMATYLSNTDDNNSTYKALDNRFDRQDPFAVSETTPFSSERKWSSVTLADGRTLVLGAPERLCRNIPRDVKEQIDKGKRVLFVGLCRGEVNVNNTEPVAYIIITDKLRKNAVQTVEYFYNEGIDVKVISGDNPYSASAVAKLSGIRGADRFIDATGLTDEELAAASCRYTVFGRVTPEQKRIIISSLQEKGHKVAMTGDGVNDLLAMRQADCSAAMGNGSDAAKQTAQLVLIDSDFSVLRDVIAEGRRVINNLTKSAGVFFIKTIYSVLLCILCLIMNTDFPFIPIQITLIDAVIEAFPAFFMSFERNDRKVTGTFLGSAVRAAMPNALAIFICCILVICAAPYAGVSKEQMNLIMYLTVGIISLAGVVKASIPFNRLRGFLSLVSPIGFFSAAVLFAPLLGLPHLAAKSALILTVTALLGILLALIIRFPKMRCKRIKKLI